jgi:hypothetical protein
MLKITGTVELKSGEVQHWTAGTSAMAEWELWAHRHGLPTDPTQSRFLWMHVLAYYGLTGGLEGFDAWRRDLVAGVDVDQGEDQAAATIVPPTLREASGE